MKSCNLKKAGCTPLFPVVVKSWSKGSRQSPWVTLSQARTQILNEIIRLHVEGPGQGWGLCQGAGPERISARTARLSHSRGPWGCSAQAKSGTRTTQSAPEPTARTPTAPGKESSCCGVGGGDGGTVNYLEESSPTPDGEPARPSREVLPWALIT